MDDTKEGDRIAEIERRLSVIEKALHLTPPSTETPGASPVPSQHQVEPNHLRDGVVATVTEPSAASLGSGVTTVETGNGFAAGPRNRVAKSQAKTNASSVSPATVMAGGAAVSFVWAAAYVLGVLIISGWLTPLMQLLIAAGVGVGLIVGGLGLTRYDRRYASWLTCANSTTRIGGTIHVTAKPLVCGL